MNYTVKSEKGDKLVSLVLRSGIRRWLKHLGLLGTSIAIVFLGCKITTSPSLRSKQRAEKKSRNVRRNNVALRPTNDRPDADEWSRLTWQQMEEKYLKCDNMDNNEAKRRIIHDPDTWMGMREAYISVVGKDRATVELDLDLDRDRDDSGSDTDTGIDAYETAFLVPFEIRHSPSKGRGIFATRDVPKGEVLYDFSQSAQFWKRSEFVEFLRILQPNLACDVVMWSYGQDLREGFLSTTSDGINGDHSHDDDDDDDDDLRHFRIITDLDPGSFCNDGYLSSGNMAWLDADGIGAWDKEADQKAGIKTPPTGAVPVAITRTNGSVRRDAVKSPPLVAVRDIQEGEEFLCIYDQFAEDLKI